ncbi:MAG: FtsW/RodA/SpoVE family cell cycle protein [Ruminococcus callidus]
MFASDTDIVFSTICEEWGFLVALLSILILMAMMLLPMINKPRSYFHTTMILCCVAVLIVQMGLNIFGSCNLIPFTGSYNSVYFAGWQLHDYQWLLSLVC